MLKGFLDCCPAWGPGEGFVTSGLFHIQRTSPLRYTDYTLGLGHPITITTCQSLLSSKDLETGKGFGLLRQHLLLLLQV
jgi:hypothetical protein